MSKEQAQLAVITAREQLVRAQSIGRAEREVALTPPPTPPAVIHFAFDKSDLQSPEAAAVTAAATYMLRHPDVMVDLVGYTDPIGTDAYNSDLGMRRAEAVAGGLMVGGVDAMRISTSSKGKENLVSTDPHAYNVDRRTELHFWTTLILAPPVSTTTPTDSPDPERARRTLEKQIGGPPYHDVERYVPHDEPSLNTPQEDWHWGALSIHMRGEIDTWIRGYVSGPAETLLKSPKLDDVPIPDPSGMDDPEVVIHPRAIVKSFFDDFLHDPIKGPIEFLGDLIGTPPGP